MLRYPIISAFVNLAKGASVTSLGGEARDVAVRERVSPPGLFGTPDAAHAARLIAAGCLSPGIHSGGIAKPALHTIGEQQTAVSHNNGAAAVCGETSPPGTSPASTGEQASQQTGGEPELAPPPQVAPVGGRGRGDRPKPRGGRRGGGGQGTGGAV